MKNINLGELEKQIMDILWKQKECSTRDVLAILEKDKKLAYTTVATILHRLHVKGLLSREDSASGYIYSPKVSRENYTKNVASSFIKTFINSFGDTAIASFADSIDKLPEKKRNYFLEILDEYDKNK
jgi:predicted transcriptional regulator